MEESKIIPSALLAKITPIDESERFDLRHGNIVGAVMKKNTERDIMSRISRLCCCCCCANDEQNIKRSKTVTVDAVFPSPISMIDD